MKKINIITIIGVGLIGGSLGLSIRKKHLTNKIIGFGRNIDKLKMAKRIGAVDCITTNLQDAVKDADVVVLCLPVKLIIEFAVRIRKLVKKGCIITDVGSTKKDIVCKLDNIFLPDVYFIGSHPLAGSHTSGIGFAKNNLFSNTTCIVTPTKNTNELAVKTIEFIWKNTGAKVISISPDRHDKLIAMTSHLPHLFASSLVNTVLDDTDNLIRQMVASGFKDTTRIAVSNPLLWLDIYFTNKNNILLSISTFKKEIGKMENALRKNDHKKLLTLLESAKNKRELLS